VAALQGAGASVELLPPVEGLPDLVFTANAGIVHRDQFVPAHFRHPERQDEVPHDVAWFEEHGFRVTRLPERGAHEGAGDALPFAGGLLSGYRFRSDAATHAQLSRLLGVPVRSVELVDPRLYHVDLTFCPLDERRAMVAPAGWDSYGCRVVQALVPEPLELSLDDALQFCANSVVVDRTVVMPACPVAVGRQLEQWGFEVVVCPMDEFLKAGGGCRCLTLALDVDLGG
jgi:N-dimethylarginine dimethylaminohydrolase